MNEDNKGKTLNRWLFETTDPLVASSIRSFNKTNLQNGCLREYMDDRDARSCGCCDGGDYIVSEVDDIGYFRHRMLFHLDKMKDNMEYPIMFEGLSLGVTKEGNRLFIDRMIPDFSRESVEVVARRFMNDIKFLAKEAKDME